MTLGNSQREQTSSEPADRLIARQRMAEVSTATTQNEKRLCFEEVDLAADMLEKYLPNHGNPYLTPYRRCK